MAVEYIFLVQVIFFLIPLTKGRHVLNTLETPIREALLKPRNFNPHPYYPYDVSASALEPVQEPYSPVLDNSVFDGNLQSVPQQIPRASPANGIYSQGPVQFPSSEESNEIADVKNYPHPYARLKTRGDSARNTNLATLEQIGDESLSTTTKKHYEFSYTVKDSESGDDFSHSQQQKNGAVQGTYKVQLPDGRVQVVKYTADSDGYRADVSYLTSGPAQETQLPTAAAPPTNYYSNAPFSNGHQSSYVNAEVISNNQPQQHGVLVNVNPYAVGSSSSGAVYHHQNSVVNTATPAPTAPDIFVSTSKPIYGDDHFAPLTANLDYSTSQSGTYVVSAKSTQVHSNYDYSPEYDYRENGLDESAIVQRSTGSNRLLVKEPQALYYKTAK